MKQENIVKSIDKLCNINPYIRQLMLDNLFSDDTQSENASNEDVCRENGNLWLNSERERAKTSGIRNLERWSGEFNIHMA